MLVNFSSSWYNLAMKTKIFVDFDGTIFNTQAFREKLFDIFVMAGFDEDEIRNTYVAESLDFLYSAHGQMKRLFKIHEFDMEKAKKRLDKLIKSASDLLFDDFEPFIKNIDRNRFLVNLMTLGNIEFQKKRVEALCIGHFFDNIYYCDKQKWDFLDDIVDINEKFIIIDDRADTMEKIAKKFKRSFPIFINRPQKDLDDPVLQNQHDFNGIEVKSLKQVGQYF